MQSGKLVAKFCTSVLPSSLRLHTEIQCCSRVLHKDTRESYTRSVRKVSDRIFLCEHLMDYNLARLHEPTLNLSAHA